ncbi:MAG: hypothetical protein AB7O98_12845 [Hyphomonadaceae bacterium]
MSEGEVIEQLVEFTNILLIGVSLIFSIVSAYVVALNYFIGEANFMARLASFAFMTLILGMLMIVLMGAGATHAGLIERLHEIDAAGELTAAGRAVLSNANPAYVGAFTGRIYSIDEIVRLCTWAGLLFVYIGLAYLTFLHSWRPDVINVAVQDNERSAA